MIVTLRPASSSYLTAECQSSSRSRGGPGSPGSTAVFYKSYIYVTLHNAVKASEESRIDSCHKRSYIIYKFLKNGDNKM